MFNYLHITVLKEHLTWQRRMEKKENKRTNIQLKMTSFKQVCFKYMLIFILSVCNCYYGAYKIAKENEGR